MSLDDQNLFNHWRKICNVEIFYTLIDLKFGIGWFNDQKILYVLEACDPRKGKSYV